MLQKIKEFFQKFSEAFISCGLAMVQGDISILKLGHFVVASKTGLFTAIGFLIASYLPWKNKLLSIWLTGVITSIADLIVHPSHFGGEFTEAIVTGIGAMFISYIFTLLKTSFKEKLNGRNQ